MIVGGGGGNAVILDNKIFWLKMHAIHTKNYGLSNTHFALKLDNNRVEFAIEFIQWSI